MALGKQRAGKQPTKFQIDCGIVANYIRDNEVPKAIDYCREQGINEKTFAEIYNKVDKQKNKTEYYAVVGTYKDGSQFIAKGDRAISINDDSKIEKNMLYSTLASAKKGMKAQENDSFVVSCEIRKVTFE